MQRHEWVFEHTAEELAKAAERQRDFRAERADYWKRRKEEVVKTIRDSGINVHESQVLQLANLGNYTMPGRGHGGTSVTIDETLIADLDEATKKFNDNQGLRREYDGWLQIFAAMVGDGRGDFPFDLHQDDWLYFFGRA